VTDATSTGTPTAGGFSDADRAYMARALLLAGQGLDTTDPNPRVGCVLVRDGRIVGEGAHLRAGGPHAEVFALRAAGAEARGATAYVTLEPCNHHGRTPPCSVALVDAGVERVVYALRDPNPRVDGGGAARLAAAGIRVEAGLMAGEAAAMNPGFLRRMAGGLPWVRVKLAMSLDARTALAGGESRWITGEAARQDVQRFRARSSVVLTGSGTVLADDPAMTVRLPGSDRQPLRVVLDSLLRTPATARILDAPGNVLVVGTRDDAGRRAALEARGARVEILPADAAGHASLAAVLARLSALQANEVWVEAGPVLAGAFVAAGLVDELVVYVAPSLIGGDARPLVSLPSLASLDQRRRLVFTDFRAVGDDLRLIARPVH
jgi:diaminohydroxyphosphoribosylaminopyrimidine deaminase / 5-amino-6-(5-phosphoribosylamino)uracil reductase